MAVSLDIFAPQYSTVAKGLEGKVILVYGGNNLGKTKQATRMKKPFYLPFEAGLNAIPGIILQLVLIPVIMVALGRAKYVPLIKKKPKE